MLTKRYRPKTFAEMKGASLPRAVLQAMVRKAPNIPQSVILCGGYGTGKTTSARIFARALNCEKKNGDACNCCPTCLSIGDNSPLYTELDVAIVGNVDVMRSMRDSFGYTVQKGTRVVVFDEAQTASKAAQSALLTALEEAPPGVVFVFATTDPEMILPTIVSRSVVLQFELHTEEDLTKLCREIGAAESISVSDETIKFIVRRVRGHARDAVQAMELIGLVGEESYCKTAVVLDSIFSGILKAFTEGKVDDARALINSAITHPVLHLEQDFSLFINSIADSLFLTKKVTDKRYRELVFFYLKYHRLLVSSNDWFIFLTSLASLFEQKAVSSSLDNRFTKKV